MNTVKRCCPVSSMVFIIHLRAVPFNITVVQSIRPSVTDQIPKDILVVQGDWNAKVGNNANENWQSTSGPFFSDETNERRLKTPELNHL